MFFLHSYAEKRLHRQQKFCCFSVVKIMGFTDFKLLLSQCNLPHNNNNSDNSFIQHANYRGLMELAFHLNLTHGFF